ncbi:MAG: DNA repair protein RecO [Clostridia bacterium]|nr:DNA repair protein RecO [Clostridia bacterium]
MPLKTDALIIREYTVGEADRFVTALTRERGVIRASARGAQKLKSRNATATSLLTYSRLTLTEGRDKYIITEAAPLRVFFDRKNDIYALALGQYFCELAGVFAPREEPAEDALRQLLNALHLLSTGGKDRRIIKAVTELRLLSQAGYMPALGGCARCGRADSGLWLSPVDGTLRCDGCGRAPDSVPVSDSVLAAMRYIIGAPIEKAFAFSLPDAALTELASVCERFLLCQSNHRFKTLEFYHSL